MCLRSRKSVADAFTLSPFSLSIFLCANTIAHTYETFTAPLNSISGQSHYAEKRLSNLVSTKKEKRKPIDTETTLKWSQLEILSCAHSSAKRVHPSNCKMCSHHRGHNIGFSLCENRLNAFAISISATVARFSFS